MLKLIKKHKKLLIVAIILVVLLVPAWWYGCPIFGPWTPASPNSPSSTLGDTPAVWGLNVCVEQSTDLLHSLVFTFLLFAVGLLGVWNNDKNVLVLMLCIELILLSSTLNFVIFSILWYDPVGQVYALVVLTMAACESAVGLGLLISAYYLKKSITFNSFRNLKG